MRTRRIAVIGAGPSGLFAAQALCAQDRVPVAVELIDRLPAPYGLLRYGVAPDHTNIKQVAATLARTFENEHVSFLGNVEFGTHVTHDEVLGAYDAVIYAVGATEDTRLGIPGEDLPGSRSAREFVEWYGGHPDAIPQDLSGATAAAVIGVGNVAVDVARVLLKEGTALEVTDMPESVLDVLRAHHVDDVWLIARRGPQHAAFTPVELAELLETPGVAVDLDPAVLEGISEEGLERRTKTNLKELRAAAERTVDAPRRTLHLRFWHKPVAVEGEESVTGLVVEKTRLDEASGRVVGTGETETLDVDLVFRSIGYRSVPLPGVPFDESRGVIANVEGRVCEADGTVVPREYVVGWVKRGPTGVIGTNKSDATKTVRNLLDDLEADPGSEPSIDLRAILQGRGVPVTDLDDWRAIDAAEVALGETRGRTRTKLETWQGMLACCRVGAGSPS